MTTLLETSHLAAQVPLALHATCPGLYLSLACVGRLACDPPASTPIVQALFACLSVCLCLTFELFTFSPILGWSSVIAPHS